MKLTILKGIVRGLALLPICVARTFGTAWGWCCYVLPTRVKATTAINVALCFPELPSSDQNVLVRTSLAHTGRFAMETGIVWYGDHSRLDALTDCDVPEAILANQRAGRGTLLLTPHFGNWELMAFYLEKVGMTALYDPPDSGSVEELITTARQRWGGKMVPTSMKGLRVLLRDLKNGGVAVVLPDQVPTAGEGRVASFFGQDALTMTLAHRLVRQSQAVPLMAFVERVHGGFRLQTMPLPPEFADADPDVAAAALNRGVEAVVSVDPAQYQWEYKRFRRVPGKDPYRPNRALPVAGND